MELIPDFSCTVLVSLAHLYSPLYGCAACTTVRHFVEECERDLGTSGKDTVAVFHDIALRLSNPGAFAPPFNAARRLEAGLDESWYLPVAQEMEEIVRRRHESSPKVQATSRVGGEVKFG